MASPGRPTLYNEQLADRLCTELMGGRSLRRICEDEEWAPDRNTVLGWLARDVEDFYAKYARAREIQAEGNADDIQDIADTHELGEIEIERSTPEGMVHETKTADMIEHRKLRISVRQWNAEKLRPKVYGQKVAVEHSGSISITTADESELRAELLELLASGRLKLPGGLEVAETDEPEPVKEPWEDLV